MASPLYIISFLWSLYGFLVQFRLCICSLLFRHSSRRRKLVRHLLLRSSLHSLCFHLIKKHHTKILVQCSNWRFQFLRFVCNFRYLSASTIDYGFDYLYFSHLHLGFSLLVIFPRLYLHFFALKSATVGYLFTLWRFIYQSIKSHLNYIQLDLIYSFNVQ